MWDIKSVQPIGTSALDIPWKFGEFITTLSGDIIRPGYANPQKHIMRKSVLKFAEHEDIENQREFKEISGCSVIWHLSLLLNTFMKKKKSFVPWITRYSILERAALKLFS